MPSILGRVPFPIWLALLALAVGWPCSLWEFGADDVRFVRNYTRWLDDGLVVEWSRVAADYLGAWDGNDSARYWRPIVSTSLALDFSLFGLHAGVTAAINLVVHWTAAVLLWRIGLHVFPGRRTAALGALLFVATPLAHENIAWAVGRCGLTVPLGLAAGLALLRAEARAASGIARFVPALAWIAVDLATMESALVWLVFPPLCVLMRNGFRTGYEGLVRDAIRDAIPFGVLGVLYLGLRMLLLGGITGEHGTGLEGGFTAIAASLWIAFSSTLCPLDTSYWPEGLGRSVFRALCFAPWVIGWVAPFYLKDPRSRGYRIAIFGLLGFWILARLPGLTVLEMTQELAVSRTAYYAYAPLALATALLASTIRYARWGVLLLVACFAAGLLHRLSDRADWAQAGARVRTLVYEAAVERKAVGEAPSARPIAVLSMLDGKSSAPSVHVGELPLMLYPPFVPQRVQAVSLYGFAPSGEPFAGAWLAKELGGVFTVGEPADPTRVTAEWTDPSSILTATRTYEAPELGPGTRGIPALVVPQWARGGDCVLALTAGRFQIVVPLPEGGESWPDRALDALSDWRRTGGANASFAGHIERRTRLEDPRSTTARSRAFVGRISL